MNHWAAFLAQTPPTLQRLIASSQRISLPRNCSPAERLARLRAGLCRGAAVRATYFSLSPTEQQALQDLRAIPRGLVSDELSARFGPIRPLTELRVDRTPRSLSECLLLLGWLLPRPGSHNHPIRYLLPPELRTWLPVPLTVSNARLGEAGESQQGKSSQAQPCVSDDAPVDAPALRAATTLLAAAATTPLPLRGDGRPTAEALRLLRPRLAPLPAAEADALCVWLLPLLGDLGLFAPHGAAAVPGPAAPRFLAATPVERLHLLTDAWVRAARPERWVLQLRVNTRGLDWTALRRRLLAWAAALPPDAPADPVASHALLQAALGPLADGTTHGLCASPRRVPWLPRRAAEVWTAACKGPLVWLGKLRVDDTPRCSSEEPAAATENGDWQGAPEGIIRVPHGTGEADLLTLAPFAVLVSSDATGDSYRLSRISVAAAASRGHDPARLRVVLLRRCGALPKELEAALAPAGGLRMCAQTVLLSDDPAVLEVALRRRSVRRAVEVQLAPGVALVAPGCEEELARALARDGRVVAPPPSPAAPSPAALTPSETATLLLAAAHYRASAPVGASAGPADALLERLRAGLSPALAAATDAAIAALIAAPPCATATVSADEQDAPPAPPPLAALLEQLRATMHRRGAVRLRYQGADEAAPRERIVRPLRLERHGPWWYLYAYCLLARDERCFRLDRVSAILSVEDDSQAGAEPWEQVPTTGGPAPRRPRSAPRGGFFAEPPDPSPSSPLVRIWLDDTE